VDTQARLVYNAGAFPGAPLRSAIRRVFSHYRTPNLKIDAYDVVTNTPHVAAYRAPGATPTNFALESVVDEVGEALHFDSIAFRLQNVSRPGDPMPDGVQLPSVSLTELLQRVQAHPCWTTPLADMARRTVRGEDAVMGYGSNSKTFSTVAIAPNAAVHVADVEVDRDTGAVKILQYTTFQDVGLCINPDQVEGQMQGGATQGIGWALSEVYTFDDQGVLQNANLLDYRIPTSLDVPRIATNVVEEPSGDHPYGIRAVGQVPIVPPAAAIANAIYRATGVRLRELPMTPERLHWALKRAGETAS
jgi:CO/xanthine dehydrogenase Mo-binding subunit